MTLFSKQTSPIPERDRPVSYRAIMAVVIPMAMQAFMLALVSATDAVMLGFVDQTSLSAVSLASQVQFVLSLFVLGICGGMGILVAQFWGKQDRETIEKIVPMALRPSLLFGILFTLATWFMPQLIMVCFTNDSALIAAGAEYLKMASLSYVLCSVSQIYLGVLKNVGRAKISSVISCAAVIFNIVGNGIFIFGLFGLPAMGIRGAALATVLARLLEVAWSYFETRRSGGVRVRWRGMFRILKALNRQFWKYTLPLLGAFLVWGVAFTLYSVIMGYLGNDAVAANSITGIAKSLVCCLIRGLGSGTSILVGNLLGAGKLEKAKQTGIRLVRVSLILGIVTGFLLIIIAPFIVKAVSLTPTATAYLKGMLIIAGINIAFQSVNITILDGLFSAGGDAKYDALSNIFAMWCFSVPLGFIAAFVFKWPVLVVFVIVNLDEIVKIPAIIYRYKQYRWVRNLTEEIR